MKMATARRRSLRRAIVLGLAGLLAACGGTPTTTAPAGTGAGAAATPASGGATAVPGGPASVNEPCTLLTEAEIRQVTGFDVRWTFPNKDVPGDLPVGCNWSLGTSDAGADIVIGVRSPGGAALFDPADGDPVEGICDRAIQTEPAVVEVVKGDTYVSVTYIGYEDRPDIPRELARLIMEKV
jgi:hypothetical protein